MTPPFTARPTGDWGPVSLDAAKELLDMTSGNQSASWQAIGEEQLKGAVDLYRRLCTQQVAWLCDEVGLGKTYVAMAVAALVRRQHPEARILYLLPTTRLLPKWKRELRQFSRRNVRTPDHLLRTLQGVPARPLIEVPTLHQLALETALEPNRDFLCTLGAFSFGLQEAPESWRDAWEHLLLLLPPKVANRLGWAVIRQQFEALPDEGARKMWLKVAVAEVINRVLPDFDLVICDESHNLRHGLSSGAARNQMLSVALGGVHCNVDTAPNLTISDGHTPRPLRRRARRVLMLTATPFRTDFIELSRQAAVFGFTRRVERTGEAPPQVVDKLEKLRRKKGSNEENDIVELRDSVVQELVIRRLGTLTVGDESLSRNRYRTELREGGMKRKDSLEPLPGPKVHERLILALVQKRVLDVLEPKDSSSGWRFQMGLLSSFESFGQTLDTPTAAETQKSNPSHEGEVSKEGSSTVERETNALDQLIESYQQKFQERMPHPKLEEVAKALAEEAWKHGEKSLVFVRRVRTTEELATRVTWHIDELMSKWIRQHLSSDALLKEWDSVWKEFERYRNNFRMPWSTPSENGARKAAGARSLFWWYFRYQTETTARSHKGIGGILARRGLERSRPWAVLLEDNPVLVWFDHDEHRIRKWVDTYRERLEAGAKNYVHIDLQKGGTVTTKQDALHSAWFLAYQASALDILAETEPEQARGIVARKLRAMLFPVPAKEPYRHPVSAYSADKWLTLPTVFSTLQASEPTTPSSGALCTELWGPETDLRWITRAFETERKGAAATGGHISQGSAAQHQCIARLLDREHRRIVAVQLLRNGRSYLDLWLSVVNSEGSLERERVGLNLKQGEHARIQPTLKRIVDHFITRMKTARETVNGDIGAPGTPLTAYRELALVQKNFALIRDQNFAGIQEVELHRARTQLRTTLTGLEPAIAVHGSSKTDRALEQFRMPGFPLVMVSTSVLQEGVDLHTFCRKVVHYGIDGSATGTEQRNGRVDRRGSMVSRLLDRPQSGQGEMETIDVYFPHLRQTLEPLQMAALYRKMNRFLLMANNLQVDALSGQKDMLCAVQQQLDQPRVYPEPYKKDLISAFQARDVTDGGPLKKAPHGEVHLPELQLEAQQAKGSNVEKLAREGERHLWRGTGRFQIGNQTRSQPFLLQLKSGLDGGYCTLVIQSPVVPVDVGSSKPEAQKLQHALEVELSKWNRPPGMSLLSKRRSKSRVNLYLVSEVPLPPNVSMARLTAWIRRVVEETDKLEHQLVGEKDHSSEKF